MTRTKTIIRLTQACAEAAMARHIAIMLAAGWTVGSMFCGDRGLRYKCKTYFHRAV